MAMISKDIIAQEKAAFAATMATAMKSGDEAQMAAAFADFSANVQEAVMADARELSGSNNRDTAVLAGRGVRQLTNEETNYYNALGKALSSPNPKAALTGAELIMPQTVIDTVLDDLKRTHPLLDKINFRNTYGAIKMLVNKQGAQTAVWGKLNTAITEMLEGAFGEVDATANKLTAYMPVSKDLVQLGPQWLDRYVREVLTEALALGLETAIVTGTGKDMPVGMDRNVSSSAAVVDGVTPKMTPITITDLSPTTMGMLCAKLARDPLTTGGGRPVTDLVLITNPLDYWGKVMPATTFLLPDGSYARNILPVAADIIQSAAMESGRAIFGISQKYMMLMGMPKEGRIEYDDSVHFLQDERVYAIKTVGEGFPMDEYAFLLLDISGLEATNLHVTVKEVKGTVKTKEQTA